MNTGSAERPVAKPQGTANRARVIIFRVVATLAGHFFVVAVALMASALAPRRWEVSDLLCKQWSPSLRGHCYHHDHDGQRGAR